MNTTIIRFPMINKFNEKSTALTSSQRVYSAYFESKSIYTDKRDVRGIHAYK